MTTCILMFDKLRQNKEASEMMVLKVLSDKKFYSKYYFKKYLEI